MMKQQILEIHKGLMTSIKRFPNCKIANCDCNSKEGERIGDCLCLCHIQEITKQMKKEVKKIHEELIELKSKIKGEKCQVKKS